MVVYFVPWWFWLVAGLLFMSVELLLLPSGFFLFFVGAGAILTGLLALALPSLFASVTVQGTVFLVTSLLSILLLRKPLLARIHFRNQHPPVSSLLGQTGRAYETIAPQATGKVELHGSSWSALNIGPNPIQGGTTCQVHGIEGLTLHVKS